jgi:hypothetical protein
VQETPKDARPRPVVEDLSERCSGANEAGARAFRPVRVAHRDH